jgi:N-acyl amino acid synthase of PEP-CTERM/exosortase system
MDMIYRLRFNVYAHQCKFIREDDYPEESESDDYDPHSVHFAVINPRGMVIATARMILPEEHSTPLLKSFPHFPAKLNCDPSSIVEISRFMICKKNSSTFFLNSEIDSLDYKNFDLGLNRLSKRNKNLKAFSQGVIVQGLCQEIFYEIRKRNIKYWCALMENGLWMLLNKYGVKMRCMGDTIDLFGSVRPFIGKVADFDETNFAKLLSKKLQTLEDPEEEFLRRLRFYSEHLLQN